MVGGISACRAMISELRDHDFDVDYDETARHLLFDFQQAMKGGFGDAQIAIKMMLSRRHATSEWLRL